jgi:hypothetical protein
MSRGVVEIKGVEESESGAGGREGGRWWRARSEDSREVVRREEAGLKRGMGTWDEWMEGFDGLVRG